MYSDLMIEKPISSIYAFIQKENRKAQIRQELSTAPVSTAPGESISYPSPSTWRSAGPWEGDKDN